jgi:hypothetical protein
MPRKAMPVGARFARHYAVNSQTQCWEWTGAKDKAGYALFNVTHDGKPVARAHRFSFLLANGYLPEAGRDIDHKCNVRHCVNPDHLQDVTHAENMENRSQNQTRCARGHEFDEQNTAVNSRGDRVCKKCQYLRVKEWRKRQKAEDTESVR